MQTCSGRHAEFSSAPITHDGYCNSSRHLLLLLQVPGMHAEVMHSLQKQPEQAVQGERQL